jgi:hypothetical protein
MTRNSFARKHIGRHAGGMRTRMHEDEFLTDPDRRLLEDQLPQWVGLRIALVDSYGTDHDMWDPPGLPDEASRRRSPTLPRR